MITLTDFCGPQLRDASAATIVRLLVLAPLLEEWITRAGLHAWLLQRRVPAWLGVPLAAAAFSALHAASGAFAVAAVFGPALLLGMAYQRWRSWPLCAALHGLMNALALTTCNALTYSNLY